MDDRQIPRRPIRARTLNRLGDGANRHARMKAAAPLGQTLGPDGIPILRDAPDTSFAARLSGTGSPYSIAEVYGTAGGGWTTLSGGRSCSGCAYEWNSTGSLTNKVALITSDEAGNYRFLYPQHGGGCSVTITVLGCNAMVLSGASVTLLQNSTTIGSGTSDSNGKVTINGVTSGTYTLQVTASRFANYSQSVSLTCPNATATAQLTAAAGYQCHTLCAIPLPTTLHATCTVASVGSNIPVTLTYSSTAQGWTGQMTGSGGVIANCAGPCVTTVNPTAAYVRFQQNPATQFQFDVAWIVCGTGTACAGQQIPDNGSNAPSWPTHTGYGGNYNLPDNTIGGPDCPMSFRASFGTTGIAATVTE